MAALIPPSDAADPTAARRYGVACVADVEHVRRQARDAARRVGFGRVDAEEVALAVSELATNLVRYTAGGEIVIGPAERGAGGRGLRVESVDAGPGIPDVAAAQVDGYSTGGGLGGGLGAVRRLMDECLIESSPAGTRVVATKWRCAP